MFALFAVEMISRRGQVSDEGCKEVVVDYFYHLVIYISLISLSSSVSLTRRGVGWRRGDAIWVPPWNGQRSGGSHIVFSIDGVVGSSLLARSGVLGRSGISAEAWLSGIVWMMPGSGLAAVFLTPRRIGVSGEDRN